MYKIYADDVCIYNDTYVTVHSAVKNVVSGKIAYTSSGENLTITDKKLTLISKGNGFEIQNETTDRLPEFVVITKSGEDLKMELVGKPVTSDELQVLSPKLSLSDNNAGSLTFKLPPNNLAYDYVKRMTTKLKVFKDDKYYWEGRVISEDVDFWNCRSFICEGELAYFNDTIQPPGEYHNITPEEFLRILITNHNEHVTNDMKFYVGQVTVTDPNNSIFRYTNYETTLECINKKLIEPLGGHIRIRHVDGYRYIDYLAEYTNVNTQTIMFGRNLLDFTKSFDMTDFATVIVPRGAEIEEEYDEDEEQTYSPLTEYLTVESVNGGSIYVQSEEAVKNFGWIVKVVDWDDVTVPENLLKKAKEYLSSIQFDNMTLELSAVDLHYIDKSIESFEILDRVRAISGPHGLDHYFPVTKITIPLDSPENTTYSLGTDERVSLTQTTSNTNAELSKKIDEIPSEQKILNKAQQTANSIIKQTTNGYITIDKNDKGTSALYVSELPDYKKSLRYWKWDINGLAYTRNGGESYESALTMDGKIMADAGNFGDWYIDDDDGSIYGKSSFSGLDCMVRLTVPKDGFDACFDVSISDPETGEWIPFFYIMANGSLYSMESAYIEGSVYSKLHAIGGMDNNGRVESLDEIHADGSIRYIYASSKTTTGKPRDDASVLHMAWGEDGQNGWDTQLAVLHDGTIASRSAMNTNGNIAWGEWRYALSSNNIYVSEETFHSNANAIIDFALEENQFILKIESSNSISMSYEGNKTCGMVYDSSTGEPIANSDVTVTLYILEI